MTIRSLAIGAGVAAMALTLAACTGASGTGTETESPGASGQDGPVDLTMTLWTGDENVHAAFQELAEEFRADNPELGELTIQVLPFAEYVAQLTVQLQGGDAPDIGWIVDSTFNAWVDSGALYDMSALKDDPDFEFDDIIEGLYAELEGPNGEFLGYPFANTTHPVIYNSTVFESAGVDTPLELFEAGEWTWDNLKRISKELVDSGEVAYGFDIPQFAFTSYALFMPIQKGFGAVAWPEGTMCGLESSESVEATEFLHSMIFEDGSYSAPGSTPNFASGDTGMIISAPSILAQLTDIDFEFEVVPQPRGTADYNPFLGQAALSVFAGGEAPDLATELVGYFASPHGAERLANFYVPPRSASLTPESVAQLNPLLTPEAAERSLIDTLEFAKAQPFPVSYPEVESTIKPILDGLWVADADIPAVLGSACAAADPLL